MGLKEDIIHELKDIDPETYKDEIKRIQKLAEEINLIPKERMLNMYENEHALIHNHINEETWDAIYEGVPYIRNKEYFREVYMCIFFFSSIVRTREHKLILSSADTSFLERFYIRIKLIKNGWNDRAINNVIQTHYNIKMKRWLTCFYFMVRTFFSQSIQSITVKGRPSIPAEIRKILKNKTIVKERQKMNHKYTVYNIATSITSEEYTKLIHTLDKEDPLVNKLIRLRDIIHNHMSE